MSKHPSETQNSLKLLEFRSFSWNSLDLESIPNRPPDAQHFLGGHPQRLAWQFHRQCWKPLKDNPKSIPMRLSLAMLASLLLTGCAIAPIGKQEWFVAAPNSLDDRLETATIEDYVIALPPFAYHEESVYQFIDQVRRARTGFKENRGKGPDYLFVDGDGCWPSKDFVLDRAQRTLRIRIYNWEPGINDYTETMRRVPGGWMHGPQVEIKSTRKSKGIDP